MSQYSHLPIYNRAFQILREFNLRVPKFGKQYKYFLGGRLIEYSLEIITIIIKANSERDKDKRFALIEHLCVIIELLIIQLRIANELRQLGGQKSYLFLCEQIIDLSKQAEGWKKYTPQNLQSERLWSEG
jgi:hypothetical protein